MFTQMLKMPPGAQVVARQLVELARVEVDDPRGVQLRRIEPDDVVALGLVSRKLRPSAIVRWTRGSASTSRLVSREERRRVDDAGAQLDRVDALDGYVSSAPRRVADAEADVEHAPRRRVQQHRDVRVHAVLRRVTVPAVPRPSP